MPQPAAASAVEALDLETINYLVKKGKVKDSEALEKQLNKPKEKLHSIDFDGDGRLDKFQIIEVRQGCLARSPLLDAPRAGSSG